MWKITGKVAAAVGKLVAAALLISFLSIWTTGYVVNSYVETLLKQFHIPMEEKPFALSGLWGEMWGANPEVKDDANSNAADSSKGTDNSSSDSGKDNSSLDGGAGSSDGASTDTGSGSGEASPPDGTTGDADTSGTAGSADTPGTNDSGSHDGSVDAFGDQSEGELSDIGGGTGPKGNSSAASGQESADSSSGAGTGSSDSSASDAAKDGVAMSTDEINAAKSQMSEADKEKLFNGMKKLPQDAWQQISTFMEDGLTPEEMTQVKQLMAQYLDRSEYDEMSSILSKY